MSGFLFIFQILKASLRLEKQHQDQKIPAKHKLRKYAEHTQIEFKTLCSGHSELKNMQEYNRAVFDSRAQFYHLYIKAHTGEPKNQSRSNKMHATSR